MDLFRAAAPRVATIEGQRVLVVERRPPLPSRLAALLASPGIRVYPIRISGWRSACEAQEHRLLVIAEGWHQGPDGVRRDLRIHMCADCESVCVRDVSIDRLPGLRVGRSTPLRRDHVLGWYTGARRSQREYR